MSEINIPKSAHAAIQSLIHLSAPDFEAFLGALSRAEPSLDQDKFWEHVAMHVKQLDRTVIESILHEIFQMDTAREMAAMDGLTTEEFAESVVAAAASAKSVEFPFEEADKQILEDRMIRIIE